ncbi:MAG: DUF262 domain-containing protein, partial [Campylobacter sp.]|nr:DUF262 domain-containing protein [Campylobacter sp.]
KLGQDLQDFMENKGSDPYFFGTIIISCQENDTQLSLIDGQQRTTTFILLFKALLMRLNIEISRTESDRDSDNLRYALAKKRDDAIRILYKIEDNDILEFLNNFDNVEKVKILDNNSINELYRSEIEVILNGSDFSSIEKNVEKIRFKKKDNKYTNYFKNLKFFYNCLSSLSTSELNSFAECILNKAEIIEIRSWNIEQAIAMFNSLNSDGMPLLDSDIISAKLYSYSANDREDFNLKWVELKEIISKLEQKRIVNIDSILL